MQSSLDQISFRFFRKIYYEHFLCLVFFFNSFISALHTNLEFEYFVDFSLFLHCFFSFLVNLKNNFEHFLRVSHHFIVGGNI